MPSPRKPVDFFWNSEEGYQGRDIHIVRPATGTRSTPSLIPFLVVRFDQADPVTGAITEKAPAGGQVTFTSSIPVTTPPSSYESRFGFRLESDGRVTVTGTT